jgi:hypothetical protein
MYDHCRPVTDPVANAFHRMLCGSSKPSELALPVTDPTKASRRRYCLPTKLILCESQNGCSLRKKTHITASQKIFFQPHQLNVHCDRERGERVLEERLAADHAADTEAPAHSAED